MDASEDARPLTGALGRAIALACEELGVELILDDPLDRLISTDVITGSITYPDSWPVRFGRLVVVKGRRDLGAPAAENGHRVEQLCGVGPVRSYR